MPGIPFQSAVEGLTDAAIQATVADNELLAYDSTTGLWINQTAAEAAISVASHTHTLVGITDVTALVGEVNLLDLASLTAGWVLRAASATTAAWAAIQAGDLPTAIDAAKLADGSVSNTEFQYLNGVSSAIQTQLDAKAPDTPAYILQTANAELASAQVLGALATGLVKNTTTTATGVLSIGVADTDYQQPVTWGDGLGYSAPTASVDYNTTNLKITAAQLDTIQGISSAASPTFAGMSLSDGNLTNVGDAALDSITADGTTITIGSTPSIVLTTGTSIAITLGTDPADDFLVRATALVVEGDTGHVGIGTATPSTGHILDVNGDVILRGTRNNQSHNDGLRVAKSSIVPTGTAVIDVTQTHCLVAFDIYVQWVSDTSGVFVAELIATINSLVGGTTGTMSVRDNSTIGGSFQVLTTDFVVTRPSNGVIRLTYTNNGPSGNMNIQVSARVFTFAVNAIPTITIT